MNGHAANARTAATLLDAESRDSVRALRAGEPGREAEQRELLDAIRAATVDCSSALCSWRSR